MPTLVDKILAEKPEITHGLAVAVFRELVDEATMPGKACRVLWDCLDVLEAGIEPDQQEIEERAKEMFDAIRQANAGSDAIADFIGMGNPQ
jgi:hypothetical protein